MSSTAGSQGRQQWGASRPSTCHVCAHVFIFVWTFAARRVGQADGGLSTAQNLVPGTLGGTYGGGPLACAAAVATLDVIEGEGLLQNAEARGRQLVAVRA